MSWKIYFWKRSELILYLSDWWGILLTGVNGKLEISSPSLTPSALALGEQSLCGYSCWYMMHLYLRGGISRFTGSMHRAFSRQDWIDPWATWPDPMADPVMCWRWGYRFPVIPSRVSCVVLYSWIAHLKIRRSHFPQNGLISPQKWALNALHRIIDHKWMNEVLNLCQKHSCWKVVCKGGSSSEKKKSVLPDLLKYVCKGYVTL